MRHIIASTLSPSSTKPAKRPLLLLALLLCLGAGLGFGPGASQPAQAATDAVETHCLSKAPKALDSVCKKDSNITNARNAASYHCEKVAPAAYAACVVTQANKYFDDALSPRPSKASKFQSALDGILTADTKKTGGSTSKATSKKPTTAIHRTTVNPGSLPQVDANSDTLKSILTIVFNIIGAFALLSIVASGLKYITAGGDAQKTSEAKNGIIYSLVGLIVAISAQAIVAFVVKQTL